MLNAIPKMVNIIPPAFSHFHAMMSMASKTSDGIRLFSHRNKLIKRIAKIQSILAVQYSTLVDVFILNWIKSYTKLHLVKAKIKFI